LVVVGSMERHYDLIILGGGPAGAAAMLALKESGLKILVVDKSTFPKHKPCGDAIPFQAIRELEMVWRGATEAIRSLPSAQTIFGCRLFAPSGKECHLPFINGGMTATRYEFDELLFRKGLEVSGADHRQSEAKRVAQDEGGVTVHFKDGSQASARMLIGADGANSVAARAITEQNSTQTQPYPAAARYHLKGNLPDQNALYIWFPPEVKAGYFWAFPLRGGMVNAGIGAFPGRDKKQNLKQVFNSLLKDGLPGGMTLSPPTQDDAWLGQVVPCADSPYKLCGDNIMLVGDAAGLVQAATGEGIGHAVVSGMLAGTVARGLLKPGSRSNSTKKNLEKLYARPLLARIEKTMHRQHRIVWLASRMPWLVEGIISLGRKNEWVARQLRSI